MMYTYTMMMCSMPSPPLSLPPTPHQGRARRGPTLHECLLLHAVSRLALHPHITNIQASWVKMGPGRAAQLLTVGCNDMGGSIMNESITRAAGACGLRVQGSWAAGA